MELENGFLAVSKETIREIAGVDMELEELYYEQDQLLIPAILTAEGLKRGFDNLLLYTRHLRIITKDFDNDIQEPILIEPEEWSHIKRYLLINWRYPRNFGIHVKCRDEDDFGCF